ncbi:MAG: TPM domain-containing protein [Gemmatimonadaceae bacterium]
MKNPKKIVFGVIVLVAMVMATCFGNTLWGQNPLDSLRKASPRLAKFVPPVPAPASFVADVANVLVPASHDLVDSRIRAAQEAQLGDIGAAILPSIGDFAPAEVALAIYRTWRVGRVADIGSTQRNLGVLILLVPKELAPNKKGECFILTGRGSEGVITDATAAAICRDGIIPFMKERDYTSALLAGVDSITARVRGDVVTGADVNAGSAVAIGADEAETIRRGLVSQGESDGSGNPWLIGGISLGVLALAGGGARGAFYIRRNRKRTCPKCGNAMHKLSETVDDEFLKPTQMLEEKLGSVDYDVWQCSCGETLLPIEYVKHLSSYSKCPECQVRAQKTTRRTIRAATYSSTGLAEKKFHCESCGKSRTQRITLSQLTTSSSSGGSSGGSSSSGSSFGGSGSSSGGGGGSSY